jgi:phage gp16-like protein
MGRSFASVTSHLMRSTEGRADSRVKLLRAVRAAANRIGIEDDDRKALQLQITGKASLADMTPAELGKMLDHFNRDDKGRGLGGSQTRPHISKVRALWWTLYWLNEVDSPNDKALDAFVRRQTGIAALRFLDHRNAPAIIEALKKWAERAGVRWPLSEDLRLGDANPGCTIVHLERHAVLDTLWGKLRDDGQVHGLMYVEWIRKAIGGNINHLTWSARELDEGIKILGKKYRKAVSDRKKREDA